MPYPQNIGFHSVFCIYDIIKSAKSPGFSTLLGYSADPYYKRKNSNPKTKGDFTMTKKFEEQIANVDEQIVQLENRRKELLAKHKKQLKNERTHRICERGGYIEKVLPETITLPEEVFRAFIDKTLVTDFSRRILDRLKDEQAKLTAAENADENTQNGKEPTATLPKADAPSNAPSENKPAAAAKNNAATVTDKPPEAARTAG
jgi:hypothetical protein